MTDCTGFGDVTSRLGRLEMHRAVDEVHRKNVELRLAAIEDVLKWLVRLVIGALVLGMMAFALNGGLVVA
ncbi:hemolysin XhlA family protein [Roseicyclus sp. F158]|uniref:Hemolysin XhlA family protein n=1 Tax=Tropicimonas omnivorans TaxID=3075590 RepID=A0ABU3DJ31_9RHOB|nr:hemolysin XhlA family protein [Roseicyclus sp. F158]MDT0683723.1 hemolysin XhlA family protein [Roseicyclus sp. F158]